MRSKTVRVLCLCVALGAMLALSGCGWWDKFWGRDTMMKRATPEDLYAQGYELYQDGKYEKAIEAFRRVRESYPLNPVAIMAELGIADSYFSNEQYADAEVSYSEFVDLHPTNPNVPYVLYQIGMCHFNQMQTVDRDQTETVKAKNAFERLVARFPGSKFAFLGEKKLKECRQQLAEHEFYVGYFYFNMKKYQAAIKRFEGISKNYDNLGLDYKVNYFLAESKKLWEKEKSETRTAIEQDPASVITTPVE